MIALSPEQTNETKDKPERKKKSRDSRFTYHTSFAFFFLFFSTLFILDSYSSFKSNVCRQGTFVQLFFEFKLPGDFSSARLFHHVTGNFLCPCHLINSYPFHPLHLRKFKQTIYLFIEGLYVSNSTINRTGSPQGFSQVQISHKLSNTIKKNLHIT